MMPAPAIDVSAYNEFRAIMGDTFFDVLKVYVTKTPKLLNELEKAVSSEDTTSVFRVAHNIKSSSSCIGALGIADTAEKIEYIGKAGNVTGAEELLRVLQSQFRDAREIINDEFTA